MKRGKVIWRSIGVGFLLLLVLFIIRTVMLEHEYPTPRISHVAKGETLYYNGCALTVETVTVQTLENPNAEYLDIPNTENRYFIVKMHVENQSEHPASLIYYNYTLQWGAFRNGIPMELFYELNADMLPPSTLEPGYEQDVYIPFMVYDVMLTKSQWKRIDQLDFNMVIETYPTKYVMELKPYDE